MNTHCTIAERTPMSRTRRARTANAADSWAGRPNSFTSVAPGAEKRSVICVLITALWLAASRSSRASRLPIRRAGTTNSGSNSSASTVICQEILIITARVSRSATMLLTTPESVLLKARCAPMTSLFNRLTSAPVRVRVKNAMGIRCTWSNTAVRRSRIRPSPIVADSHLDTSPRPASATAMTAMSTASPTTTWTAAPRTIASTTRPASTGVATARTAVTTPSSRNQVSCRRRGRAKPPIRRRVALEKGRRSSCAVIALCIDIHAVTSMLMEYLRSWVTSRWCGVATGMRRRPSREG